MPIWWFYFYHKYIPCISITRLYRAYCRYKKIVIPSNPSQNRFHPSQYLPLTAAREKGPPEKQLKAGAPRHLKSQNKPLGWIHKLQIHSSYTFPNTPLPSSFQFGRWERGGILIEGGGTEQWDGAWRKWAESYAGSGVISSCGMVPVVGFYCRGNF